MIKDNPEEKITAMRSRLITQLYESCDILRFTGSTVSNAFFGRALAIQGVLEAIRNRLVFCEFRPNDPHGFFASTSDLSRVVKESLALIDNFRGKEITTEPSLYYTRVSLVKLDKELDRLLSVSDATKQPFKP